MKFRKYLALLLMGLPVICLVWAFETTGDGVTNAEEFLEEGFRNPPDSAKPFVYWYWINQNISKKGITADLEAMKRVGIGGGLILQVGLPPEGNVPFLSREFNEAIGQALKEAHRLGLRLFLNNGDAWSGSGGPWITPELSMKENTWSQLQVASPMSGQIALPKPYHRYGFYEDIAVVAFPISEQEWMALQNKPVVTSNMGSIDTELVIDPDPYTADTISPKENKPIIFNFHFKKPFTARSLSAGFSALLYRPLPAKGMLQISDNGLDFTDVQQIELGWRTNLPGTTFNLDPVTATHFRLLIQPYGGVGSDLFISDLKLHPIQKINYWEAKAGYAIKAAQHEGEREYLYAKNDSFQTHSPSFVPADSVIVLTDKIDKDGNLQWKVPKGKWNILRIGYTTSGQKNAPSTRAGEGLESDKLNPIGIEKHFPQVLGRFLKMFPESQPQTWIGTHTDSWEYNNQNWTQILQEEFKKRRKYDLMPFLAALAGGYQIGNKEITERFLPDIRTTLSELITENYFLRFREIAGKEGLQLSGEGSGGDQFMYHGFTYQSALDIPMGEFWVNPDEIYPENRSAASAAHIFDKPLVASESFTSSAPYSKWQSHPYSLKSLGDRAFTSGINWLWLHTFVHQPRPDIKPGLTLGGWGTHFEHTNTWFDQSKPWMEYLSRCQYMLQQGEFQADLLYLMSEQIPSTVKSREELGIPQGYDYDVCDKNVILNHLKVENGKFVTESGMSYQLLILPDEEKMSLELLQKIASLIEAGGHVVGRKVMSSNSLMNYPANDQEVEKLAGQLWGKSNGKTVTEHAFGSGKVYWGKPVPQILADHGLQPDFASSIKDPHTLSFIHRKHGNADYYFVANKDYQEVKAECTFRIQDKMPEIWYAEDGKIQKHLIFQQTKEGIRVPLHFDPVGAYFIVFREKIPAKHITSVSAGGRQLFNNEIQLEISEKEKVTVIADEKNALKVQYSNGEEVLIKGPAVPAARQLNGKWSVSFPPNLGAPDKAELDSLYSLHLHQQEGIKFFSGTATYTKELELSGKELPGKNKHLYLDLGKVAVIASVKVNGQEAGILWKEPYIADISDLVKSGRNKVEIAVTNLWKNRLIGDENYPEPGEYESWGPLKNIPQWYQEGKPRPETQRVGFVSTKIVTKEDQLVSSGLLGPVNISWRSKAEF